MPVYKYRSVAEMPPPPQSKDDLAADIRAVWNRAFLLAPANIPRGVTRFRTMEAANAERDQRVIEQMRRTRAPKNS